MEWVTTTLLLDRLCDYEDSVWRTFAERFHRPVIQFALRAGLPDQDAEDVAQETLLAFANSYREGRYDRNQGALRTWLFSIARHKIVDAQRTRQRRRTAGHTPAQNTEFWADVPDAEIEAAWESSWEEAFLHHALPRIRKEFRESTWRAFERMALEGGPPAETAEALGVSTNAVFIAKHRVLQRLREMRAEYEGRHDA